MDLIPCISDILSTPSEPCQAAKTTRPTKLYTNNTLDSQVMPYLYKCNKQLMYSVNKEVNDTVVQQHKITL